MKHSFIAALSAAILLSSCASQRAVEKVRYFQDLEDGASYATRVEQAITVKPEDKLTIVVNSKDPELAGMYNRGLQLLAEPERRIIHGGQEGQH